MKYCVIVEIEPRSAHKWSFNLCRLLVICAFRGLCKDRAVVRLVEPQDAEAVTP